MLMIKGRLRIKLSLLTLGSKSFFTLLKFEYTIEYRICQFKYKLQLSQ